MSVCVRAVRVSVCECVCVQLVVTPTSFSSQARYSQRAAPSLI